VKFRIGNHKLMIETGRYISDCNSRELIDFVLVADPIKLRMKLAYFFCLKYSIFRDTFYG